MGCAAGLGAGNHLCWGRLRGACWWARWTWVSDGGRVRWATEVGVYKSADVCISNFAVDRKSDGFSVSIPANFMDHSCSEIRVKREID